MLTSINSGLCYANFRKQVWSQAGPGAELTGLRGVGPGVLCRQLQLGVGVSVSTDSHPSSLHGEP